MPQPYTIQFGPWAPDLANIAVQMQYQFAPQELPCADCLNVYYSNGRYQSLPTKTTVYGTALPTGQCVGAFTFIDPTGSPIPIVGGVSSPAYYYSASSWTSLSFSVSGTTTISKWNFSQFGAQLFASYLPASVALSAALVTGGSSLWMATPGVSAVNVTGAPNGAVMAVVGQFLMIGDIFGPGISTSLGTGTGSQTTFTGTLSQPTYPTSVAALVGGATKGTDNGAGVISGSGVSSGSINYDNGAISVTFSTAPGNGTAVAAYNSPAYRSRVQWSAIGNGQSWPTPLTDAAIAAQSSYEDLEYEYGPIMFISGYPLYGVIFQRNAITRASYVGGQVVFSFATYARNQGLIARNAAVQVGPNTYFLSDSGFFVTDGANVTPIGTAPDNSAGIDAWFWANVNTAALNAISASYDARSRCVFFAIPTGSNTLPDTLLTYNVLAGRWTRGSCTSEYIWTDSDGSTDRIGIMDQSHKYNLLTGTPASGYLETCDTMFTDAQIRYTTGARPNINCTDTPSVTIGNRNNLQSAVSYSSAVNPDSFSNVAPFLVEGLYTRVRVTSAAATAFHGATLFLQPGGAM